MSLLNSIHIKYKNMPVRGAKVERTSVSEQPHELNYEAKKEGTTPKKVEAAKHSAGSNKRTTVEKKLVGKN